jgi:cupin 2 domain-containing protein
LPLTGGPSRITMYGLSALCCFPVAKRHTEDGIIVYKDDKTMKNIFSDIPDAIPEEIFETIIEKESFRLERIVSDGQLTAEDEWYDEDENEWFILLKGSAGLLLEGDKEPLVLKPGDYLNLPGHRKHKVLWTDADEKTIWLALHYK